jgi:hypothetical protein
MKKNSRESFAAKAKKIINTYKRASFDKNEKAELDAALQKLSEEQELYKQVNKIGEYSDEAIAQKAMQQQQMMAQQGQMQPDSQVGQMVGQGDQVPQQFWEGGTFGNISDYGVKSPLSTADIINNIYQKNTMNDYNYASKFSGLQNQPSFGATGIPMTFNKNVMDSGITGGIGNYLNAKAPEATAQSVAGQDQQIGQTQSILPSVIAGGIGMLGNIALGAGVKEYKLNQSYSADQISLAKERERLAREATTARNIGMRNLRGAGSRGAYLAGAGNVSAGINQQLGDALSKSYFNEETTNLAQREKAAQLNRQVEMMNYQAKINADNERKGYYAAAAAQPGKIMADIGNINYQNAALLSSGTDNYLAGTNGKATPWKSQQIMRKFNRTDGGDTGVRKVIGYTADGKEIYNKK